MENCFRYSDIHINSSTNKTVYNYLTIKGHLHVSLKVKSKVSSRRWIPSVQRPQNRVSIHRINKRCKRTSDATIEQGYLTVDALNFIHCPGEECGRPLERLERFL